MSIIKKGNPNGLNSNFDRKKNSRMRMQHFYPIFLEINKNEINKCTLNQVPTLQRAKRISHFHKHPREMT